MCVVGDSEDNGGVRVDVREVPRAAGTRGQRQHGRRAGRAQAHLLQVARRRHPATRPLSRSARSAEHTYHYFILWSIGDKRASIKYGSYSPHISKHLTQLMDVSLSSGVFTNSYFFIFGSAKMTF